MSPLSLHPKRLTLAIPAALLLHVPPWVPLVIKLIVDPTHTEDPPDKLVIVPASCTVIFAD